MGIVNRLKILRDFLRRTDLDGGLHVEIGIEMTNRCNLKCTMCARETMTRSIGDMPLGLLKKIIYEV